MNHVTVENVHECGLFRPHVSDVTPIIRRAVASMGAGKDEEVAE